MTVGVKVTHGHKRDGLKCLSVVGFHSLSREKSVLIPIASQRPLTIYDGVGHWNPKDPG
jgi:hypothetical protein